MSKSFIVGVVGNPNCGKTTLFNALTGARQHVGNWPGVTVEKKTGDYRFDGCQFTLVDLPGTYSLESADDAVSLDEKVARDFVASQQADLVVNIVDASNIERNLYLTTQLLEMRVPMLIVLNMMDVVNKRGIRIDEKRLGEMLGCPIACVSAASKQGIQSLKALIRQACISKPTPTANIDYHPAIEQAIAQLQIQIESAAEFDVDNRWLALRLLEQDTLAKKIVTPSLVAVADQLQREVEQTTQDEIDILAADARYGFVSHLVQTSVCKHNEVSKNTSERIDGVVLNRFLGIPIFLLVMYAMFMFTINIGSAFVDFFDQAVAALLVDGLGQWLTALAWPEWLTMLITKGIGGGVQVVATFIPIVGFLFIFLSMLEDSGYMSRAAFVMDRFMCLIGLPGKSFVPMIVGFGCNVPAIIATRTLDNQRDRILTNLMNPFMSCGARLPVYALFAAAFFPVGGQNLVFGLYLFGIVVAVFTGLLMRHTLLQGEATPFVMELPSYHMPTLRGVAIKTWDRLHAFIFNAGKLIVPMVLVLNILNSVDSDGHFGRENSTNSVLSQIGRALTPLFAPMGISDDNWPATVGIFTGVLAKEAVVGTLNSLYSQIGKSTEDNAEAAFDLAASLQAALATIPENLAEVAEHVLDPLGLNIGELSSNAETAEKQEVDVATYAVMQQYFDGGTGAFAYLLFILLYTPCVAATAAIYKETSAGWAVFVVCWTSGLAYVIATLFYQLMTYDRHPETSLIWLLSLSGLMALVVLSLRIFGSRQKRALR